MRAVFGLVLVAGVGLAGFAVLKVKEQVGGYQTQLNHERAARAAMVQTSEVFVVDRQFRYGEQMTAEDLRPVQWPVDAIPEGAFGSIEELFPEGGSTWRTVTRTMEKDEAVLAVKVTEPGLEAGIQSRLTRGMRAFAIKVDVTSGVSGFLRPGDRVDVYWSGQSLDREVTKLIENSVQLIAIDQSANDDLSGANIARTVTVQITPQQVASLAQAQSSGRLSLSLVGAEDDSVAEVAEVDQNVLLGIEVEQTVQQVEEQKCFINQGFGAAKVQIEVECES